MPRSRRPRNAHPGRRRRPSPQDSRRGVRYREAAAGTGTGPSGARRSALAGAVVGFSRRAVASPPPIEQRPSSSAPSCTTRLAVVTLPRTRPDARSSSRSRAVTSPVTPPSMTIDVPEIFAFTTAPSPTVSASCAEISPSTWPSIRAVPSSTSLPLTLVPLPRNVSIPPGPASWLVFRSRSNIATSPGAIPSTGMTGTGIARGAPRLSGLHATGGKLGSGAGESVRLALLGVVFRSAGLPQDYAAARFVLFLKKNRFLEPVEKAVEKVGRSFESELNDLYVSPVLAEALLVADPTFAASEKEVRAQIKAQFPRPTDVSDAEMAVAIEEALGTGRKLPC